jgi:hypothetical protein
MPTARGRAAFVFGDVVIPATADDLATPKVPLYLFTIFVSARQQIIVIVAAMKTFARYRLTLLAKSTRSAELASVHRSGAARTRPVNCPA